VIVTVLDISGETEPTPSAQRQPLLLESLPIEIINQMLVQCFKTSEGRARSRFPADIQSLSRQFQNISLELPEIWAYLRISYDSTMLKINLRVRRSRNRPLEVEITSRWSEPYLDEGPGSYSHGEASTPDESFYLVEHLRNIKYGAMLQEVYQILAPRTNRIVSLDVQEYPNYKPIVSPNNFIGFFNSNFWPVLQSCSYHGDYLSGYPIDHHTDFSLPPDRFPSIIRLRLYGTVFRGPLSTNITELHVSFCLTPYPVGLACFRQLPHLERLFIDSGFERIPANSVDDALQSHGPPCHLLNLQVLSMRLSHWTALCMLLCFLQTPNVRHVVIRLSSKSRYGPNLGIAFGGRAWSQVRLPGLCTLELRDGAIPRDNLLSFLTHMPSSLTRLIFADDPGEGLVDISGSNNSPLLLHPDLAGLRGELISIRFRCTPAPDILSLVRDGGCTKLTSIVLDIGSSTFHPALGSWEDFKKHSRAIGAIRQLEGVDVELRTANHREIRPSRYGYQGDRYVDEEHWKEHFPDELQWARQWEDLRPHTDFRQPVFYSSLFPFRYVFC